MRRTAFVALAFAAVAIACTGSDPAPGSASGGTSSGTAPGTSSGTAPGTSSSGTPGTSSSGTPGTSSGDADVDAGPCDPSKPFGYPRRIDFDQPSLSFLNASLSSDLSTMIVVAPGVGQVTMAAKQYDFSLASRADGTYLGLDRKLLGDVNNPDRYDLDPSLTADGLGLFWLQSTDSGTAIRHADRADIASSFTHNESVNVADLSGTKAPHYLAANTTLYFVEQISTGIHALASAPRLGTSWTYFSPLHAEIVDGTNARIITEQFALRDDGLEVYVTLGNHVTGNTTIGLYRRTGTTEKWVAQSEDLSKLDDSSGSFQFPTSISPDGCTLFFTRGTPGMTPNSFQLFSARRGG